MNIVPSSNCLRVWGGLLAVDIDEISKLEISPVQNAKDRSLQGFLVKGFKRKKKKKSTGFIVNRIIQIQADSPATSTEHVKTTLRWLIDENIFEIEERIWQPTKRQPKISQYRLGLDNFDFTRFDFSESEDSIEIGTDSSSADLEPPYAKDNKFVGKLIELSWNKDRIHLRSTRKNLFKCTLKRKDRSILITI